MRHNTLKQSMFRRRYTVGSWITQAEPSIAEIMVDAGFEWLVVDMEHSAITFAQAQDLVRVISRAGSIPLVRVGENSQNFIKRAMDIGAYGVVVPMVNTASDAQRAVESVKYPPWGKRGVGLARAQGYGLSFETYKRWVNKETVVIAQIEHIEAVRNLEEILSIRGIDGTIIGPYDLSASLGVPGDFQHPEFTKAVSHYESTCRTMKKPAGFHVVRPDVLQVRLRRKHGYCFIAVGLDTLYLGEKCREILRKIR